MYVRCCPCFHLPMHFDMLGDLEIDGFDDGVLPGLLRLILDSNEISGERRLL